MPRTAIITGASSGIGKATAVVLAEAGHDVGFTYAGDAEGARGTADEIEAAGRRAVVRQLDLEDPTAGPGVIDDLVAELGHLDVFVNNAGEGSQTPFLEQGLDEWRQVLDVDLTGAFLAMQTAARHMVARGEGGRIVAITSVHEHVPLFGSSAYCAAKGGLGLLLKVMALELGEHDITVNAVAPGEIATKLTGQHDERPERGSRPGLAVTRPGDAFEIAHAVRYLASAEAAYTTGASLNVDGGLLLMGAEANRRLAGA